MSVDRISSEKRKASDGGIDSEDIEFPPQLKPILTAWPRRPCRKQRLLEFKNAGEPAAAEFKNADAPAAAGVILPAEQVDVETVEQILAAENVNVGVDADNLNAGDEGCETPKSEEHRIPKILTCPPAPRKPRPTARRKTESAAQARALFVNPSELNLFFGLQSKNFQVR